MEECCYENTISKLNSVGHTHDVSVELGPRRPFSMTHKWGKFRWQKNWVFLGKWEVGKG